MFTRGGHYRLEHSLSFGGIRCQALRFVVWCRYVSSIVDAMQINVIFGCCSAGVAFIGRLYADVFIERYSTLSLLPCDVALGRFAGLVRFSTGV
jgi:hypothetical protein